MKHTGSTPSEFFDLVRGIVAYGDPDEQAIALAILGETPKHRRRRLTGATMVRSRSRVYFASYNGLLKVGTSVDPEGRCRDLFGAGNFELLGSVPGSFRAEALVHRTLARWSAGGEMFLQTAPVMAIVRELLKSHGISTRPA